MKLPEPFSSLGEAVEQIGAAHPEDPALRHVGSTLTRGELAARARSIAAGWRTAGFQPGEVVGIAGEGGPALALALLSASRAGLVPLLLDPRTTSEEARVVFTRAEPKALAICSATAFASDPDLPRYDFDAGGCAALAGAPASRTGLPLPMPSDAAALLLVTSGTSGRPAVVALTARNLSSNIRAGCEVHFCGRGEVFLSFLPVTHAFEFTTGFLGPLLCGASIVYPGSRNPNRLLVTARDERVTRVNVVPAVLRMMTAEIRETADGGGTLEDLRRRLRSVVCGGAAATPALIDTVVAAGLPLWLGYGLTEAAPIVALGRAADMPRGATGRPLPGVEVRIEPPGSESGEILVRGPNVMLGYLGDPAATAAALRDDWLHTGDLGRLDERGHLFIIGRRKEIIVTAAGENIAPEEIETCYFSPRFAEVCAVGLPDPQRGGGERPHLAVVPAPGGDEASLRAEFARLSAAASQRAFGMTVLAAPLPRTRNLKVRRDLVRKAVLEREGAPT